MFTFLRSLTYVPIYTTHNPTSTLICISHSQNTFSWCIIFKFYVFVHIAAWEVRFNNRLAFYLYTATSILQLLSSSHLFWTLSEWCNYETNHTVYFLVLQMITSWLNVSCNWLLWWAICFVNCTNNENCDEIWCFKSIWDLIGTINLLMQPNFRKKCMRFYEISYG